MQEAANRQSLEWQSLLKHYSAHCFSAPAQARALALEPAETKSEAERRLALTAEARKALALAPFGFLGGLEDWDAPLLRLTKQSTLDGKDLLGMARLAEIGGGLRSSLRTAEARERCPLLAREAELIPDLAPLAAPLRRAIDDDGSVRDSASPTLRSLRDQERKLHGEARERLDAVLQQAFRDGHLQDKFYDFRDGRYLIPVKAESRGRVSGFVVDTSSTRATVFMEPAAVRDVNDRIKQTQLLIEEEVYRILSELSRGLHPKAPDLRLGFELALEMDLVIARGAFANRYEEIRGVSRPEFADEFFLEECYHPLLGFVLPTDQIVRNTFRLGPTRRVLVISGPNTGGKTVLLKALGLSALMARAGFFLPCAGEARLPFFSRVLAQVGDAQNLELSLSSFSGSVLQLKEILESAEGQSLVLVDEILHATDPDEATALSRALLGALQRKGSYAVVTTHLNGLKVKDSFESASMEFDPDRLLPTYRLRMGVPGSSRALEIALKLGLPADLVAEARSFLSAEKVREQAAVDELEARERELRAATEAMERATLDLATEQKRQVSLNEELSALRKRFRSEALDKLKFQQQAALQEAERIISFYKKQLPTVEKKHEAALGAQADMERLRESFQRAATAVDEVSPAEVEIPTSTASREESPREDAPPAFRLNAPVKILSLGTMGTLLSDPSQRKKPAEVMVGTMRMKMLWENLEPVAPAKPKAGSRPYATSSDHSEAAPELHLIGKTVEEARALLEAYMDRAARSGRPYVRLVHGLGSGALRKMVRETLRTSAYEMKFRAGTAQEGGEGCTVVEFI